MLKKLYVAAFSLLACSPSEPDVPSRACRQTYEFGNYGCTHIVLDIAEPLRPWPERYRWTVYAIPARAGSGAQVTYPSISNAGTVPIEIIRWEPFERTGGDTVSIWLIAKVLDDTNREIAPLPTFAADSVLRLLRFVPVGQAPAVYTVRLEPANSR